MRRAKTTKDPNESIGRGDIVSNFTDENDEPQEWYFEENARYFMGYFWWHYKRRGNNFFRTWLAFAMPQIKREWVVRFSYSIGLAIGYMIARTILMPEQLLPFYTIDFRAAR